ncbi:MAG: histone deacetylase [Anaerolineae bacterium]|nr:histone deacetylase [Anaerolineae bacterium]
MPPAFFADRRVATHTLSGHPEHAGRLNAVLDLFEAEGIPSQLLRVQAQPATEEQLLRVHSPRHLEVLARTEQLENGAMIGADTYVFPESYGLARLAAGGVLAVVDAVCSGAAPNGLATVRPPGHHAPPEGIMGFCLLNHIALGARQAQQVHGLARVAIVDFDVHHGNGTQDAFYADPGVLFISSHQSPLYPGTGATQETGQGAGKGFTCNLPLPALSGDEALYTVYEQVGLPVLERFAPQLILVSAGFDAHWADPLANLEMTLGGLDRLVRRLLASAAMLCEGRIIFVMEGGYDLPALSHGWLNIVRALLDQPPGPDLLGAGGAFGVCFRGVAFASEGAARPALGVGGRLQFNRPYSIMRRRAAENKGTLQWQRSICATTTIELMRC